MFGSCWRPVVICHVTMFDIMIFVIRKMYNQCSCAAIGSDVVDLLFKSKLIIT